MECNIILPNSSHTRLANASGRSTNHYQPTDRDVVNNMGEVDEALGVHI